MKESFILMGARADLESNFLKLNHAIQEANHLARCISQGGAINLMEALKICKKLNREVGELHTEVMKSVRERVIYREGQEIKNPDRIQSSFQNLGHPVWSAFEPRRFNFPSPLSIFLERLLKERELTVRDACRIAGCSPSVLHGWLHGAYPTDTVIHLKKLCNYYGYTLAEALTGSPDKI